MTSPRRPHHRDAPAAAPDDADPGRSCRWEVPATARRVSGVRREAVAFAERQSVLDPPIADLRLALGEALANVVMHAFEPGEPGTVTVTLTVDPQLGEVRVCVSDDGRGMAPRLDSPGLGLGMPLIAKLADRTHVSTPAGGSGTDLAMAFSFAGPAVL